MVDAQFGPRAEAYVRSAVHAAGEDLDALEAVVGRVAPERALDLGCGGGHVAYRMAAYAGTVTACDLSDAMLVAVAAACREKGLANIETRAAPAEHLPFADAAFDFLGCRFSAHHWQGFRAGLREARRVLKPGSVAVFIDAISPGPAVLDTHLQAVELLRDTSHVRDYNAAEWLDALTAAGFNVVATQAWQLRMDFPTWVARIRTPDANCAAIRTLQDVASDAVRAHFRIEADGSFMLDTLMLEAVAVG
ncbi:MAG: methyltransferase domain-containing protein [Deltaproteobacteria bacterium]|nr:MAG: methyltransferase domain-containing protein [Deltaproteobacteria bacterium]